MPLTRIVSLCPSLTELVFDLGRGDALVGRTKFCVHPPGAVDAIEKVGGTKNPKVERIVALAPDIVLMNEEENRREDADALARAGVRCHVSFPKSAPDTAVMVRNIAAALGAAEQGEHIARDIEQRHARVRAAAAGRRAVSFAYLIWREPWMTVNGDTFVSALLGDAGGRNVFGSRADRYPTIEPRELGGAAPELVLLSTEPFPFKPKHADELAELTGLARDRFHIVDGELLSWHGSRTPHGVDYAEEIIERARATDSPKASPRTSPSR